MQKLRQVAKRLGISGIGFLILILLFILLESVGQDASAIAVLLLLIPFGIALIVRGIRWARTHALWSVHNRLVFVYLLFGMLPMLLLLALMGIGAWALMDELAIYLANTALTHRLDTMNIAAQAMHRLPSAQRRTGAAGVANAFGRNFPGIMYYVSDELGTFHYPADAPDLNIPPGWTDTNGLLVLHSRFYAWAHRTDDSDQITVMAPMSDQMVEDLVPNLGVIALVEAPETGVPHRPPAAAGSLTRRTNNNRKQPRIELNFGDGDQIPGARSANRLPPAMNRFDIPILWPATFPHWHLDTPNKKYEGVLWVYSRPSAVLRTFFSGTEVLRDILFNIVIGIAILFLLVELIAIFIGVRLSRRITSAVNQLYEGTRRVIQGDFRHRIVVRESDQLGELAISFNQMTGNLERLVEVEKEKERLETELEIAREVQSQLYPKEAPPTHGLKLTVRCDPARMVSGDYYDYLDIGRGRLMFALGDVAGKGISAALLMATLQAALRAQITHYHLDCPDPDPRLPELESSAVVSQLNRQLYAHTSPEKYATFFFAMFDENTRTLAYTNAGHLSPLLFRNRDVVSLESNGTVVGAFPFSKYGASYIDLIRGDLLVCYTDGITEPENAYGEMFGEERLIQVVQQNIHLDDHQVIETVFNAVRSWTGTSELQDDMTILLAREVQPA